MAELSEAVDASGDGVTAEAGNSAGTYDSLASENPVAPAGDETIAFRSTTTFNRASHTLHTQAIRSADVIAVYFSVNGLAIADAQPSGGKLSPEVVKAQNRKLE